MQILDKCTLLQAAEYIAFGWKPLSKEEDFTEKHIRYYIGETDEKYNNILDEQLMDLDRAKITLFALIDNGLNIFDKNGKRIKIDKEHIVEHCFYNLSLGLIYDSSDKKSRIMVKDITQEPVIDIYEDPNIRYSELENMLEEYQKLVEPINHTYKLVIDYPKKQPVLYLQKDDDVSKRAELYVLKKNSTLFKIIDAVVSDSISSQKDPSDKYAKIYTRENLLKILPRKLDKKDSLLNRLESIIKRINDKKTFDIFFKEIDAKKIIYRSFVDDSFLERENITMSAV